MSWVEHFSIQPCVISGLIVPSWLFRFWLFCCFPFPSFFCFSIFGKRFHLAVAARPFSPCQIRSHCQCYCIQFNNFSYAYLLAGKLPRFCVCATAVAAVAAVVSPAAAVGVAVVIAHFQTLPVLLSLPANCR